MSTYNMNPYISFVPEYLRGNEDFLVFLQLLATEFDVDLKNIENFTDLVNPDKVPIKFIEALGSYSGYRFVANADDDFNREILTRMQTIYEQRGTDKSIVMAATHATNDGWVGGDIFIPGYDISKDTATLIIANESIFIHNRSRYSGVDVYADSEVYRDGVLIIQLPYINEEIMDAISAVIPAGVKFKFFLNSTFIGSDDSDLGDFGELSHYKCFRVVALTDEEKEGEQSAANLTMTSDLPEMPENYNILKFSTNTTGRRLRSGRMLVQEDYGVDSHIGASMLLYEFLCKEFAEASGDEIIEYLKSPTGELLDLISKLGNSHILRDISGGPSSYMEMKKDHRITARRSMNSGIRSGLGKFDGITTNIIDSLVQEREIHPYDTLYPISEVYNLRPDGFRDPFYQADIEISV